MVGGVRRLLHRFGKEIIPAPDLLFVKMLKRRGVTVVFDVGAHKGETGAALRQWGYGGTIVSYEPVENQPDIRPAPLQGRHHEADDHSAKGAGQRDRGEGDNLLRKIRADR